MKASEARKLIGKQVTMINIRSSAERTCAVLDVKGRNVFIDELGCVSWHWLPDLRITAILEP